MHISIRFLICSLQTQKDVTNESKTKVNKLITTQADYFSWSLNLFTVMQVDLSANKSSMQFLQDENQLH